MVFNATFNNISVLILDIHFKVNLNISLYRYTILICFNCFENLYMYISTSIK